MSKLRVAGSKSRCQQGEPQGAGVPPSGGCGTPGPVAASPQALPPRRHGPLVCRLCVWNLSLPFFIRTLLGGHPGSSPHLESFNLFPPAKSFLAMQGRIRRFQELGRGDLWRPLCSLLQGPLAVPPGSGAPLTSVPHSGWASRACRRPQGSRCRLWKVRERGGVGVTSAPHRAPISSPPVIPVGHQDRRRVHRGPACHLRPPAAVWGHSAARPTCPQPMRPRGRHRDPGSPFECEPCRKCDFGAFASRLDPVPRGGVLSVAHDAARPRSEEVAGHSPLCQAHRAPGARTAARSPGEALLPTAASPRGPQGTVPGARSGRSPETRPPCPLSVPQPVPEKTVQQFSGWCRPVIGHRRSGTTPVLWRRGVGGTPPQWTPQRQRPDLGSWQGTLFPSVPTKTGS